MPTHSAWYLTTSLPAPGSLRAAEEAALPAADLTEIVRLYGLRNWIEQSYKQTKGELGWSEYQVRSDTAMRRHWVLVCCAFSFCWSHLRCPGGDGDQPQEIESDTGAVTGGGGNRGYAGRSPTTALLARRTAVAQAIQVTREVEQHGRIHTDVDHFITSCSPHTADPVRLLALIRGHWSIERHHRVRDVVFGEDRSHLRTGTAPQILAALRNAVLTLLRRTGRIAISAAPRYFASHPSRAIALLAHSFPAYR